MNIEDITTTLIKRDRALRVLILTPHIVEYLTKHDPQALRQAQESLGIYGPAKPDKFLKWLETISIDDPAYGNTLARALWTPNDKISWIKLVRKYSEISSDFRNMFPAEDLYLGDTLGLHPSKKWMEQHHQELMAWAQQQR